MPFPAVVVASEKPLNLMRRRRSLGMYEGPKEMSRRRWIEEEEGGCPLRRLRLPTPTDDDHSLTIGGDREESQRDNCNIGDSIFRP